MRAEILSSAQSRERLHQRHLADDQLRGRQEGGQQPKFDSHSWLESQNVAG